MPGKLHRETLTEQAETELITFIQKQGLQPGEALPSEGALASEFGVSRQVIREALKSLQGKGFIQIINGKGSVVRPLNSNALLVFFARAAQMSDATLIELMEVRKGIEIQSAILAAERRTPEDVAHMEQLVTQMRASLHDPITYVELDVALHLAIVTAAHNTMMYHLIESIREASKDAVREGLLRRRTGEQFERVQTLHEALIEAIKQGNAEEAGRAMQLHFDEAVIALVNKETADSLHF